MDQYLQDSNVIHPSHLKPVLHLIVQSLQDGNNSIEPLNAILVLSFLINFSGIGAILVRSTDWDVALLTPLLIVILQFYFFLLPPAYITRCWSRVLEHILQLHAVAPSSEQELGSILLYMNTADISYTITNIRVDASRILYFTFLIVALLGIRVQSTVQFLDFGGPTTPELWTLIQTFEMKRLCGLCCTWALVVWFFEHKSHVWGFWFSGTLIW